MEEPTIERRAAGAARARRRAARKAGAAIREHRLQNGMRVLLAERHSDPVVCVLLFYRVGSRNESEREAGVSHFLEHMMFKGTRRFGKGEVDRLTAMLGGTNNAFTGNDHTAYWFEFASDRWERALEIEADRMRRLELDPAELEAERAVVLEELAMGEDDPWRVLARRVEAALFPRHPYGRPIIGFPDTVRGLSRELVRDYYRRFYHPGNAVLVLCGDFEPRAALREVERRFGRLSAGPAYEETDCFRPQIEPPGGETRISMTWDDAGKRLCVAWPTTRVGTDDDFALDLLLSVLASGRTSRLQRRLVHEEGLATSVAAHNDTRVEGGAFWLFAECAPGTDPERLEAALDEELARVAARAPTAREMARAREILRSSEAYDGETVTDLAEELGEYAVDADWRLVLDAGERYERIGGRELRDATRRWLARERRVVGWCLPAGASHAGEETRPARRAARRRKA